MARKKKNLIEEPQAEVAEFQAEPKAEVTPEPEIVSFGKCKHCDFELKKILFDSRAENPLYLYVCDNSDCPLYRRPQKTEGALPTGINITST